LARNEYAISGRTSVNLININIKTTPSRESGENNLILNEMMMMRSTLY
jgi:hypothetical protein